MGIDAEMFVRTKIKITETEVLKYAYLLGEAFGPESFIIGHPRANYLFGEPYHCLEIVKKISQDGPDIFPEEGEIFIKVRLRGRYYGIGYERGNLPNIIAVACWLENNIPGAEIWYGGDSSGVTHEIFDKKVRDKLFKHFCKEGHEPYYGEDWCNEIKFPLPISKCELCNVPFVRYGIGQSYAAYSCSGCGFHLRTPDSGKTWMYWIGNRESEAKLFTNKKQRPDAEAFSSTPKPNVH